MSGDIRTKQVTCVDCRMARFIRFDSHAKRCASCASKVKAKPSTVRRKKSGRMISCVNCGKNVYSFPYEKRMYCSKACFDSFRRKNVREKRQCRTCGKEFIYIVKPHSNSSGTYCSFACRNDGYAKMNPNPKSKYLRWRPARRAHINAGNDHCFFCGIKPKRISVHHIIPLANGGTHEKNNLLTVCPKCHVKAEKISREAACSYLGEKPTNL